MKPFSGMLAAFSAAAVLSGAWGQEPDAKSPEEVVLQAVIRLREADNYAFRYEADLDTRDEMLARFDGRFCRPVEGVFERARSVLALRMGFLQAVKRGEKTAAKLRGEWRDLKSMMDGRGPLEQVFRAVLRGLPGRVPPHEEAAFHLRKTEVLEERENEEIEGRMCRVFEGPLGQAAVEALLRKPLGPLAGEGPARIRDATGTARFFVDEQGTLRRIVVSAQGAFALMFRGAPEEFDLSMECRTTVLKINETTLKLPEEAEEILGMKQDEKRDDNTDESE